MTSTTRFAEAATNDQLVQAAQEMVPHILGLAEEIEGLRSLPEQLTHRMTRAGFFKMLVTRELGGLETNMVTATRVVEILSAADGSVGWVLMIAASTPYWATALLPDPAVWEIFPSGAENILVGGLLPQGRAVQVDGGYRVSGRFGFASGCQQAHWLASGCWLFDGDQQIRDEAGDPQWAVFLTPIEDCHILDTWRVTGLKGTGSHDYTIDDVFVPEGRKFYHPRSATSPRPTPFYAYLGSVVSVMSAVSLGLARAAVDELRQILQTKLGGLERQPLTGNPEMRIELAKAEALVGSARAYLYENLQLVWDAVMAGQTPSQELRGRFRLACTNAVLCSEQAVDIAHAAAGTTAIYSGNRLERCFRDVHTAAAHIIIRPGTRAEAGQLLLGIEPGGKLF